MEPSREPDSEADDLRPEYELSRLKGGVRGKYFQRKHPETPRGDGYELPSAIPLDELSTPANGTLSPDEAEAFLHRMHTELRPILAKSVVPIGYSRNGKFGVAGTGTLFRVANVSFLVTASHVLDEAEKSGCELAISDVTPGGAICLPLHGRIQGHKHHDVAVWELPQDIVKSLHNCSFLTVHHADRENQRPAKGTYYVFGYPESLATADASREKLTVNPFTFATGIYEGDTDNLGDYDPKYHILLDTPKEGGRRVDKGDMPIPTRIHGMSGCSIWQTYYKGLSTRHWTTDDAIIVAVQTGVYRDGTIVKGTRWWVVERIIRECYPKLEGPLSLLVPTA